MTSTESVHPQNALKSTREKLGLSINDVSLSTKISPRILKALEESSYSELPPQSFTRGFIRAYSAYLKIDSQPIIESYNEFLKKPAIDISTTDQKADQTTDQKTESRDFSSQKKSFRLTGNSTLSRFLVVAGLLVAVAVIFAAKNIFDHYAHDRVDDATTISAVEKITDEESTDADTPGPELQSESNVLPAPTTMAAETPKQTAVSTPAVSVAPTPAPTSPPTTTTTAKPIATLPVKLPPVAATPETPVKSETPQEVIIQALDKVEVIIQIDTGEKKKITLTPDAIHTIKGTNSISLDIKDGGMVNLIYNGKEKGVPGDLGKPLRIKFP